MSTPEQIGTEVAKGLGEATKEVVTNLLGPGTQELGQLLGDIVAGWRAKNLIEIYEKVRRTMPDAILPPEAIERLPFGFRALFVEEASKEEEDSVQDLWAALLSMGLKGQLGDQPKLYLNALKDFSPLMALCLSSLRHQESQEFAGQLKFGVRPEVMGCAVALAEYNDSDIRVALEKLIQLGVLQTIKKKLEVDRGISSFNTFGGRSEPASVENIRALARAMQNVANEPEITPQKAVIRRNVAGKTAVLLAVRATPFGRKFLSMAEEAAFDGS